MLATYLRFNRKLYAKVFNSRLCTYHMHSAQGPIANWQVKGVYLLFWIRELHNVTGTAHTVLSDSNHPWNIELLTFASQKCVAFSSMIEPGGSCVIVGGWEGEGGEGGEGERVQDSESSGLQSPTHCQEERGSCLLTLTTSISSCGVNSSGWSWSTDSEGEGTLLVHKLSWTVHLYPLGLLPVRIAYEGT